MLGLALDEPRNDDRRYQAAGCEFVVEGGLVNVLEQYMPLTVEHDDRFYNPVRVLPSRSVRCC